MAEMTWKYEALIKEYQLKYGSSILARIQSKITRKGKYIVTTLISGIYFGQKIQKELQEKKHEWVAYHKKVKDRNASEIYIGRKKDEVARFIKARENEA